MWFDRDADLLPGLMPGLFRGVPFWIPNVSTTAGRRVAEYLFPGIDLPAYDDFGLYPAEIAVEGLVIGDDYVAQAAAMQAAFETPGPATLVHPWLGPITVIMREPGSIAFDAAELRVARISAVFVRSAPAGFGAGFASIASTVTGLLSAVSGMTSAASALSAAVTTGILSSVRMRAASRTLKVTRAAIGTLAGIDGSATAAAALSISTSLAAPYAPSRQAYASSRSQIAGRIHTALPSSVISTAAFDNAMLAAASVIKTVKPTPVVAPAAEAQIETEQDPRQVAATGLHAAAMILSAIEDAPSLADQVLITAAATHLSAASVSQAAYADFESREDALAYRSAALDLLEEIASIAEDLSGGKFAGQASEISSAVMTLQSAIAMDVNEAIGRLPSVRTFTPNGPIDAWALAQHLAGDRPSTIETVYLDILTRNRPSHPAAIDRDAIEVAL